MLWRYKGRLARPNDCRTVLGIERLDTRITPAVAIPQDAMSSQLEAFHFCEMDVDHSDRVRQTDAAAAVSVADAELGFPENLGPNLHSGHVNPYGSKPGGTGDGVFGNSPMIQLRTR
jgi:hypothetical protein